MGWPAVVGSLAVAVRKSVKTDEPIFPRMLLALDEYANTAPFPRLDEVAATGAGLGVQLLTVLQDLSQMKNRLGTRAASAVNNHRTKIAVGGISDIETTEYFSRLAGMAEFVQRSTSSSSESRCFIDDGGGGLPRIGTTTSTTRTTIRNRIVGRRQPASDSNSPPALVRWPGQ
jgi:hypothetical protein